MIIEDVIVVASDFAENADRSAGARLDRALRRLISTGRRPIVVLGPCGDDVLATCAAVEQCEIVFDPNYEGQFFSSLKAGLQAAKGAAIAVPWTKLDDELPHLPQLERRALGAQDCDAVEFTNQTGAFALTLSGVKKFKSLPAASTWPLRGIAMIKRVDRVERSAVG